MLAAAFAIHGGGGVVAMDNNPTRGTLGWRTEQGPHDATVADMIPLIDHLLDPAASIADLAAVVHHQAADRYDVLRSKPRRLGAPISPDEFEWVVYTLRRYARLVIFDSGNDESAEIWRRMIAQTDQLVVATTATEERAECGRLLLAELAEQDVRSQQLAAGAVVIVSEANPRAKPAAAKHIANGFHGWCRAAITIPHDPAMVEGQLRWTDLAQTTQDAWIRAAARVAEHFDTPQS
jgi:MinD-like ATPase involved in chromosome partitioning or flagellar assembly